MQLQELLAQLAKCRLVEAATVLVSCLNFIKLCPPLDARYEHTVEQAINKFGSEKVAFDLSAIWATTNLGHRAPVRKSSEKK